MDHALRLTNKHEVTLPPAVRRALGLKRGDHIAFVARGETVTIANTRTRLREDLDALTQTKALGGWDTPEDDEAFKTL